MKAAPRPPHTHLPGPSPLSRSSHVLIRPSPPCEKRRRICQERSALREAGPIKFYQLVSPRLPLTSFLSPVHGVLPPAERGPAFVISCSALALSSQTGGRYLCFVFVLPLSARNCETRLLPFFSFWFTTFFLFRNRHIQPPIFHNESFL